MNQPTRSTILNRLNACSTSIPLHEPMLPPLPHCSMDQEELAQAFIENLTLLGAEPHRVKSHEELLEILTGLVTEAGLTRLFVNEDPVLDQLQLDVWGKNRGITINRASDFQDRRSYTDAVFEESTAGFTTVNHAVAESGTLVIAHHPGQARLITLAPSIHMALVRMDQLVLVYEQVLDHGLLSEDRPSQVTLITGPSMTADIQATPFKGMHGPKRLIVFLMEDIASSDV